MITTTPDKGFAWVVLVASLGCNYMSGVLVYFVGVIHVELLDKYNENVTITAWAGAIYSSLQMLTAPLVSWIVNRYSCRASVMLGGVFLCVGFFSSAFATSVSQLVFTYGLLAGTGLGLTYSPCLMIITFYFDKFRALASGVSVSACAVGILSGSLLVQAAIDEYGLSGAFMLIGAVSLHNLVFGMLFRPTHHEGRGSRRGGAGEGARSDEETALILQDIKKTISAHGVEKTLDARDVEEARVARGNDHDVEIHNGYVVDETYTEGDRISEEKKVLFRIKNSDENLPQDSVDFAQSPESEAVNGEAEYTTVSHPEQKLLSDAENTLHAPEIKGTAGSIQNTSDVNTFVEGNARQRTERTERTDLEILGCRNRKDTDSDVFLSSNSILTGVQEDVSANKPYQNAVNSTRCPAILTKVSRRFISGTLVLRNKAFMSHCTSVLFNGLSVSGVYLHLPEYAITQGTTHTKAAALFVCVGILSFVSRLASGFLLTSPRVNALVLSVSLQGACSAAVGLFPLYSDSYVGQIVFASLFGLFNGGFFTLINVLTFELVDVTMLPAAYGALFFAMGVGYAAGPPLAGFILDSGGTYEMSFIFLGITACLSAAFDVLAKAIHSRRKRRAQKVLNDVKEKTVV